MGCSRGAAKGSSPRGEATGEHGSDIKPRKGERNRLESMNTAVVEITQKQSPGEPIPVARAACEHPFIVRLCHWVNTVALFVMVGSGLQIFRAFPSFGAKIPEKDLLQWPKQFAIGGWLGGALQWHMTFIWIYIATGILYIAYQIFRGNYRQVLFTHRDFRGVWPMVKHYFFFGPKPPQREVYNALQKLAYTTVIVLGVLSVATGFAVWKPIQFSWLAWMMGGFHYARIWHFTVMWAILAFVLGHLVMVILHGWDNFVSMLTGWKKDPEY
jgi:Ni/Fe-hydrogenase b-type cytochrome subunit